MLFTSSMIQALFLASRKATPAFRPGMNREMSHANTGEHVLHHKNHERIHRFSPRELTCETSSKPERRRRAGTAGWRRQRTKAHRVERPRSSRGRNMRRLQMARTTRAVLFPSQPKQSTRTLLPASGWASADSRRLSSADRKPAVGGTDPRRAAMPAVTARSAPEAPSASPRAAFGAQTGISAGARRRRRGAHGLP